MCATYMDTTTTTQPVRPGSRPASNKPTVDELCDGWNIRTAQEALDEVAREIQVRERCFPNWVEQGKVSNSDAKDRLSRLIKAAQIIQSAIDNQVPE